jgi:hypothetical protein
MPLRNKQGRKGPEFSEEKNNLDNGHILGKQNLKCVE